MKFHAIQYNRRFLANMYCYHSIIGECILTYSITKPHVQLRGLADKRQVEGAKLALQQNFGIGGAAVVTLYKKHTSPPSIPARAKL